MKTYILFITKSIWRHGDDPLQMSYDNGVFFCTGNPIPIEIQHLLAFAPDTMRVEVKARDMPGGLQIHEVLSYNAGTNEIIREFHSQISKFWISSTYAKTTPGTRYSLQRDDGRSKSRVPTFGHESPPGSGRFK